MIKFILDNVKMSDKRVQRVMTDVIKYFDDTCHGTNVVVELLTGAKFVETSAFNVNVLKSAATEITYYDDALPDSIQITGVNNVGRIIYISWHRKNDEGIYTSNIPFETYNYYAKEYTARLADDDADDATK